MLLIKSSRESLLVPLQSVSGIVEKRHTLPILSNVLLERKGDSLSFLATDIEIQITTAALGVTEGNDGSITVGARKLQDILKSLPEGSEVSLVLEDKRMLVKSGRSKFNLQTLPATDFPKMAMGNGESFRLTLSQRQVRQLLQTVQYAMAQQDIRYYLNGLLLQLEGNQIRAVATDGHRLAFACMTVEHDFPKQDLILPRKTVLELGRLLGDTEDPIELEFGVNQARFQFGSVVLISKLIDGKFPDYERVIPPSSSKVLHLSRPALLQSLLRTAILTNEKFRGIRLVLSSGSLKLMAANADQEEALEEIEVDYQGDVLDIGFNVNYLLDVLNNLSSEDVLWGFNDGNSSALLTVPGNDQFKYVVMPMRI